MNTFTKNTYFTLDDQLAFAELSGDYNPVHIDPIAARRSMFGKLIVHGIHALLRALDLSLEDFSGKVDFSELKTEFLKPIEVDEEVNCSYSLENDRIRIELFSKGAMAACCDVGLIPYNKIEYNLSGKFPERCDCQIVTMESAKVASGRLELCLETKSAGKLFPNLLRVIPAIRISEVLATTRLVGMVCPGRDSIFHGLELVFNAISENTGKFCWDVESCKHRFSKLSLKIMAPGMEGSIKAFFRPVPYKQASFKDICKKIDSHEFAGQQALVIGGSRGLGEVTAKLLAAGGANVRITYCSGKEDACSVVREITSGGGAADCVKFDVLDPSACLCAADWEQWKADSLFYFATPFIFGATKGAFSSGLFHTFCSYYVDGFLNTVEVLLEQNQKLRYILYPSSVAIDELPANMCEYAAAKTAGEVICGILEKKYRDITIHKPRLNRMATDQTVSILPVKNDDPVPIMLRHLRDLIN